MSFIRGKLESDHEIVQKEVTFGDNPWRKCECCNKWFDKRTGKEVEVVETTMDELITQSRQMWMAQMTEESDSGKAPRADMSEWTIWIDDLNGELAMRKTDLARRSVEVVEAEDYDRLAQELAAVKKELAEVREEKELLYVELEKELASARAIIAIYEKALRSYEYVGSKQAAEALAEAEKVTRG